MALDERDFFNSRNETRTDKLNCPRCKRVNEYQMRWVVRTRKDRIPNGADERDRAMFAKLRDYMIRVDDAVTCKTCGKKFDIPSQHSMVFIDKGAAATGRCTPAATTTTRASIDERDDPPAHLALIARVVVAEAAHQRSLLERDGGEEIRRRDERERQTIARHVRRAQCRHQPAEIQRMPDDTIQSADLQGRRGR